MKDTYRYVIHAYEDARQRVPRWMGLHPPRVQKETQLNLFAP
jgi:hypothetical protein